MLAGCDFNWPEDPNLPEPAPVSRVVYFRATPLPLVVGDTVLLRVGIADSLNSRIKYQWYNAQDAPILPVDGRLDGPSVRMVVPNTPTLRGGVTFDIPDVPLTGSVFHQFEYPIVSRTGQAESGEVCEGCQSQ